MVLGKSNDGGLNPDNLIAGVNITITPSGDDVIIAGTGGATLGDGDYGDITVTGSGTSMTIDNDVVTFAKLQNISTDKLLGRDAAGSGDVTQIGLGSGLAFDGSNNLVNTITQYTDENAQDAVGSILTDSSTIDFTYDDALNTITASVIQSGINTDNITEGSTNVFFTAERVDDRVATLIQNGTAITWTYDDALNTLTGNVSLSTFDTDDLSEGVTNLYFTAERVDDRVAALIVNSSNITWTYDDALNTLTGSVSSLSGFDTDDLSEGVTNLYFTDTRVYTKVKAALVAGSNVTITPNDGLQTLTIAASGGGGGGSVNSASNVGSGNGVFKQLTVDDLEFKTLVAGSGISITNNTNDLTIDSTITQYTDENAQDAVGSILVDGTTINFTYNDSTPSITAEVQNLTSSNIGDFSEAVDDRVNSLLVAGNNIDLTYNDTLNTLTIDVESLTSADIGDFTEASQDAVGSILTDSSTIDFTYNDGANTISASVIQTALDHTNLLNIGSNSHATIDTHLASTSNPHSVTKTQVGLSNVENLKVNLSATTDPSASDDNTQGYSVGSRWINVTLDKEFVLLDASTAAAVWAETTASGGGGGGSAWFDDDGTTPSPLPSAGGTRSIAIGQGASTNAAATDSYAIGTRATVGASALRSIALGSSNSTSTGVASVQATGLQSICIGAASATDVGNSTVQATGEGAICIGSLKTTSSTSKTVDASGAGAICIGSRHTVSNNSGAGPTASATNSIAIGSAASTGNGPSSNGASSICIGGSALGGNGPTAAGAVAAIVIGGNNNSGNGANANGANAGIVIGGSSSGNSASIGASTGAAGIAIGGSSSTGAGATIGSGATAAGIVIGGSSSTGAGANATNANATIVIGGTNTNSVAGASSSASYTVAIGSSGTTRGARTSASGSIAIGGRADSSGSNSISVGDQATASGNQAIALGASSTASGIQSLALQRAVADQQNMFAFGATVTGSTPRQCVMFGIGATTTDATQTELTTDAGAASGTTNRIAIPSSTIYAFKALICGLVTTGNQGAGYEITGCIKNVGGTTAFVGTPTVTVLGEDDSAWDCTVSADDTNDCLVFKVTGAASTTIRWQGQVTISYMKYA